MAGFPGETLTEGLDGLGERLAKDRERGARFAKWRAMIYIGDGIPTWGAVKANAHALARYAAICQAARHRADRRAGSADGRRPRHRRAARTSPASTLKTVFQELYEQRVALEGMVLKPNMVISGKECPRAGVGRGGRRADACATLKACVPASVPGIAFLSGGQSDEAATAHLDAMNKLGELPVEADLLLRPRAAARAAEGLGRQGGKRHRRAARLRPPRPHERPAPASAGGKARWRRRPRALARCRLYLDHPARASLTWGRSPRR